jgi:hypothetical protein
VKSLVPDWINSNERTCKLPVRGRVRARLGLGQCKKTVWTAETERFGLRAEQQKVMKGVLLK